ncbi:hypothetical protein DMN91_011420 [Ooceraea biroi]|uniref:Uncharacterized protein n=1 Tax=Ooceraea biroi TaxID=2015173 RepID=A0A3L8D607_OOCBI|nr:histone H2B.v2-like isoform X2 [Ooceraea biroi]RLU15666.1 hypothetical protein DMN91_011420 [Ooceraea biroi]
MQQIPNNNDQSLEINRDQIIIEYQNLYQPYDENEDNNTSESSSEDNNNDYQSENEEEYDQCSNEDLNESNIDDIEQDEEEREERFNNEARNNDNFDQNQPLYNVIKNGAEITVRASMLIILTLLLNHNLAMSCIEDIIIAIELHCLHEGLKRNSLYKFRKYFRLNQTNIIKHYYCTFCIRELRTINDECPSCHKKKNSYFVQLPIVNQLKEMYMRNGFYNKLQWRYERPVPNPGHHDRYL